MDTSSGVTSGIRSAAKGMIKAGMLAGGSVTGFLSETKGQFKDLVAEARSELAKSVENAKYVESEKHEINQPANEDTGVIRSIYDHAASACNAAWGCASHLATAANAALVGVVAWCASESTDKARQQVERAEKAAETVSRELTEEEAVQVIETVVIAAV